MDKILSLSICQMKVGNDKDENLKKAGEMIAAAAGEGAEMVILPEVFNSPYQAELFPRYAESFPGPSTDFLAAAARKHGLCVVGGTIIERDSQGKIYNSSFVFDERGKLIGRHRKAHLFDIDIPGRISFHESDTLTAGESITIVRYKSHLFALMICYDCRFPELSRAAALEGAELLVIPAAFNTTTGPAHWKLLMRCRAVDNQLFVVAASPARNLSASYQAWGHSLVVDPWGDILQEAGSGEEIIHARLDFSRLEQVRQELPLLRQRRKDLYRLDYKAPGNGIV